MARILLLALMSAGAIFAQPAGPGSAKTTIVNPTDIDFQIRTSDGQGVFRMGERIVIETIVSSRSPGKYVVTGGCSSVPWNAVEAVSIEPLDAVVNASTDNIIAIGGHVGSCSSGKMELTEEPFAIGIELSPEVRFAHPGSYQIRVTSKRVSEGEDDDPWSIAPKIPLITPPLPVIIVEPDAEWIDRQFSEAVQTLDADLSEEETFLAVRMLRRLGTPEAVREMLGRIDGTGGLVETDLILGVMNSPHESIVRKGIESLVAAPDRPIQASLIEWLVAVEAAHRQSAEGPGAKSPPEDLWKMTSQVRQEYLERIRRSVMQKKPAARALSLVAILETLRYSAGPAGTAVWEEFRPALADVFPLLPEDKQVELLVQQWPRIKHPNIVFYLREILRRPGSPATEHGSDPKRLRSAATERIADLDSSLGRRIVIDEIENGELSVDVEVLLHLPDERLPELDEALAKRFSEPTEKFEMSAAARLIQRYATARILDAVRDAYGENNDQDCETQQAILAYFLRVDPEWAVGRIRRAVRYRPNVPTDCRKTLLDEATRDATHPELEAIAVELLNDPEPVVAARAAGWLSRNRSETGRRALWKRFSGWSKEWRGREEQLRKLSRELDFRMKPDTLETALAQALRDSGDRYDREERLRIRELCVTKRCLALIAETR